MSTGFRYKYDSATAVNITVDRLAQRLGIGVFPD